MFWVSEAIVAYIQSQVVTLATLHFLHDEGIVDIKIDSDYLLTTPSTLVREYLYIMYMYKYIHVHCTYSIRQKKLSIPLEINAV